MKYRSYEVYSINLFLDLFGIGIHLTSWVCRDVGSDHCGVKGV